MNKNFENMLEELERKYPDNWGDPIKGLDIAVYDATNDEYGVDDDFVEGLFYNSSAVGISREDLRHNYFNIETDTLIELEDFVELTKIINIVVKHLSKIEFKNLQI